MTKDARYYQEGLLYGLLFLGLFAFGATEPWSLALLESGVFALAALCAWSDRRAPVSPLAKAVLVMALLAFAQSLRFLPPFSPAALLVTESAHGTRQALWLLGSLAALAWSVPNILADASARRRFSWFVLLAGAALALAGLLQLGQGNTSLLGLRPARPGIDAFGPIVNRNHAASLLALSGFAGLGLLLQRLRRAFRADELSGRSEAFAQAALTAALVGLAVAGLVIARSRGALLASGIVLAAAAFGAALRASGRTRRLASAFAAIMVLALGAWVFASPRVIGLVDGAWDDSTGFRLSIYRSGAAMVADRPWTGFGLGAFDASFPPYQEKAFVGLVHHAHSDWLELAIGAGLPAALLLASVIVFTLAKAAWSLPERDSADRWPLAGLTAGAAVVALHSAVEFPLQTPAIAFFWVAVVAAAGLAAAPTQAERAPRLRLPAAAGAMIASLLALRPAAADWSRLQASRVDPSGAPYFLERALRWDETPSRHLDLVLAYQALAEAHPAAREVFLRSALVHADAAKAAVPMDARARLVFSKLLGS